MNVQVAEPWVIGVGGKLPSPMAVELRVLIWTEKGKEKAAVTPGSSLATKNSFCHQSTQNIYCMCDADAAWSVVQGLNKYCLAGYTPVCGVTYSVVSLKARELKARRKLFTKHLGNMQGVVHTPQFSPHPGPHSTQEAVLPHIQPEECTLLTVAAAQAHVMPELQGPHITTSAHMYEMAVHAHIMLGLQGPHIATAAHMCEQPG
jgi:hypothetical protein